MKLYEWKLDSWLNTMNSGNKSILICYLRDIWFDLNIGLIWFDLILIKYSTMIQFCQFHLAYLGELIIRPF